ncbi:H-type lectin domain-containing protein [Phanerochaete sordida]|uniref:H-type lectin domain-containing protein n=1 Tax=Phanerochaete sordida TaxID=48140 RepID=A0A9P3L7K1_9APHY|nr:H-type lectin domain-containing protein [Phanerochaete sordida]
MRVVDTHSEDPKEDTQQSSATQVEDMSYTDASVNTPDNVLPVAIKPKLAFDHGGFRAKDVRSNDDRGHVVIGEARFKTPSCYTRAVLLGLTELDLNILRIKAEVRSVADDRAMVNLTTWADTTHYGSGCSWLSLPLDDDDIQWGRYHTTEPHPTSPPEQKTSRRITFERPYAAPPRVAVWLDAVDSGGAGRVARVKVYADTVSCEGFALHLDAWHDSQLRSAGATWLAHSAGRTDVRSGAFEIKDIRPASAPRHRNRGRVSWGPPAMACPPRVFTALCMLDFNTSKNIRLVMSTDEVTTTGMCWTLQSWDDTVLYQAGAVFIALEGDEESVSA